VLALDRRGRETKVILDIVERITNAGAEVISYKEALDTATPTGRFVLSLFAGLAQLERGNIVERTSSSRNARGRKDGEKGGRVPYGYVRAAGGILIDPAAVVRRIFRMSSHRYTLRQIAQELNDASISTPKGGSVWYPGTVAVILKNKPIYTGGKRGDSEARWPAILESKSRSVPSVA
jgi:site-specific DNA recombinase